MEEYSAAEIVRHCAVVRDFVDERGCISEPQWHDTLGVYAFCDDGDALAHEISKGDERYTFEETQGKLDRWRALGPTTCKRLQGHNPALCEACKHRGHITSPIQLGHVPEQEVTHSSPAAIAPDARTMPRSWELTKGGARKPNSYINTVLAIDQLGIRFRHDVFHSRKIVEGDAIENLGPELSDPACRAIRELTIARFGFDPGIANVQQAVERACEANRFDPVCDYLDGLQWDGQPRLAPWLPRYLGTEDTPFIRAVGCKMLVAMVRRARQPGCKFDTMPVFEGVQGTGKSSALCILAGEENFSDQSVLNLDTRAQQEALAGAWICELSELAGLRRADVEAVKAFLSKTSDVARPAYGHCVVRQPRRGILVGTTNSDAYLQDATGNRRFWPARTGRVDLDALHRDRDHLFAEAVAGEKRGELLTIPETLYAAAAEQQDQRLMKDPWEDILATVKGSSVVDGGQAQERISSKDLLTVHLGMARDKTSTAAERRLAAVMRRLGGRVQRYCGSRHPSGMPMSANRCKRRARCGATGDPRGARACKKSAAATVMFKNLRGCHEDTSGIPATPAAAKICGGRGADYG